MSKREALSFAVATQRAGTIISWIFTFKGVLTFAVFCSRQSLGTGHAAIVTDALTADPIDAVAADAGVGMQTHRAILPRKAGSITVAGERAVAVIVWVLAFEDLCANAALTPRESSCTCPAGRGARPVTAHAVDAMCGVTIVVRHTLLPKCLVTSTRPVVTVPTAAARFL